MKRSLHIASDMYWKNPQFRLRLKDVDITDRSDKCTVIVSLMEKEKENRSKFAIGFDIYQVNMIQLLTSEDLKT